MKFTQYMFPDGRPKQTVIDMPAEVEALARELEEALWSFEIECFPLTQLVHADCCDEDEALHDDACQNGPEVPAMIERHVRASHAEWVKRGRPKAEGDRAGNALAREDREMRDAMMGRG